LELGSQESVAVDFSIGGIQAEKNAEILHWFNIWLGDCW
jgi:hypothetical protein